MKLPRSIGIAASISSALLSLTPPTYQLRGGGGQCIMQCDVSRSIWQLSIRIGSRLLFFDDEVETGALIGSHGCISYLRKSATEIKGTKTLKVGGYDMNSQATLPRKPAGGGMGIEFAVKICEPRLCDTAIGPLGFYRM